MTPLDSWVLAGQFPLVEALKIVGFLRFG